MIGSEVDEESPSIPVAFYSDKSSIVGKYLAVALGSRHNFGNLATAISTL